MLSFRWSRRQVCASLQSHPTELVTPRTVDISLSFSSSPAFMQIRCAAKSVLCCKARSPLIVTACLLQACASLLQIAVLLIATRDSPKNEMDPLCGIRTWPGCTAIKRSLQVATASKKSDTRLGSCWKLLNTFAYLTFSLSALSRFRRVDLRD